MRCEILRLKCTKFDFGWALSQTPLGEHTVLPQTSSLDLRGLLLKGREGREEEGREWEAREWGGKRRDREREGEGERNKNPPSDRSGYGPELMLHSTLGHCGDRYFKRSISLDITDNDQERKYKLDGCQW